MDINLFWIDVLTIGSDPLIVSMKCFTDSAEQSSLQVKRAIFFSMETPLCDLWAECFPSSLVSLEIKDEEEGFDTYRFSSP